jgi:N utilization substance protein A
MANEAKLIIESMKVVARARGVKFDYVIESLSEALASGIKRKFGKNTESEISVNKSTGDINIFITKKIVENVADPETEISLAEALEKKESYTLGDVYRIPVSISDLGRTAIEMIKQALTQKVSEAERNRILAEYEKKIGEIVKGIVKVVSRNEIGRAHV